MRLPRVPVPWAHAAVALVLAAVFVPMGLTRMIDADEGIYLVNARMTMEGQVPYHDYHYPQMFLLPYLYGAWMRATGPSWYGARMLSSVLAIGLGLALFHHVRRATRSQAWGAAAALVLATSSLAFAWLPLVKTYAFASLALFLAYSVLAWGPHAWRYFWSGVLAGLAVDVRLYVVAVIPVFAGAALAEASPRLHLRRFGLGLAVALLPNLFFLVLDPDVFLFNIVGHHAVRSPFGLVGDVPQKVEAFLNMLGINGSFGATSFQFTLLLLANLAWLAACLALRRRPPLSLQLAAVLLVVSLLPTPTYGQYFAIPLPFLVVGAVELVLSVAQGLGAAGVPHTVGGQLRGVLWVVLGLYVVVAPIDVYWFTAGGDIVPGVYTRANVKNWTIPAVQAVAKAVDEAMPPGPGAAISWWPGYFVETRTRIAPLLANPNTLWLATRMNPEQIVRYQFMSHPELVRQIRTHEVPVVVLGNWVPPEGRALYRDLIVSSDYVLIRTLGDTEIFRWTTPRR